MTTFSASDVPITRHGRVPVRFVLAVMTPVVVAATFTALGSSGAVWLVAMVMLAEAVFFLAMPDVLFEDEAARRERVALRADADGVFVGERRIVARAAIASAGVERYANGTSRVLFLGESGKALLEVWLEGARAKALLDAMALDVDHATASFLVERAPLVSWRGNVVANAYRPIGALAVVGMVLLLVRESDESWWLLALPPALAVYLAVARRFRPTARLTIGADGLALRVGSSVRTVSHASIRDVVRVAHGAVVRLADGAVLALRIIGNDDRDASRRDALVQRLEASRAAALSSHRDRAGADLLQRGARTFDAWLRDLREIATALAAPSHAYRASTLPAEHIWRIALDPLADATARAAAAFVLAQITDPNARSPLRAAAAVTARDDVKRVLLAASELRTADVESALRAVDGVR